MILCQILEVLVKKRAVGEGHYRPVGSDYLGGLVRDTVHLPAHSVTLYIIPHTQAPGHELHTVEEVVQYILHCKTETGSEACADHFHGSCRNLQQDEDADNLDAPEDNGDYILRQCEVYLILVQDLDAGGAQYAFDLVLPVPCLSKVIHEFEQEVKR